MIFSVPIEPLQERYSEQWYRWFPQAFRKLGVDFEIIDGEQLTTSIETGKVLDVYGTHYYKFSQLQKIVSMIKDGKITHDDVLFFHDLWFPGIESLAYIRDMTGIKFKIVGILHAGTWDKDDFTRPMRPWAGHIEQGWFNLFDHVFLGSEFHHELIHFSNTVPCPMTVTGLPFDSFEVSRPQKKENIIVFPHRLDKEKCPEKFDALIDSLRPYLASVGWRAVKTKDVCKTKDEYYQLLGRAKIAVSFAQQETFGFAMLEAIANGCTPIVPNALSYSTMEIYNGFTFGSDESARETLLELCGNWKDETEYFAPFLEKFEPVNVVKKMLEAIS